MKLPSFTIPGPHREWVGLREPKGGGCEKGGETVTRGPNERQDGGSREKVNTIPGSLDCLGLAGCRQRGDSSSKKKPHETIGIWMDNGYFILTLKCDHCEHVADIRDMAKGRGCRGEGNNGPRTQDMGTLEKRIGR